MKRLQRELWPILGMASKVRWLDWNPPRTMLVPVCWSSFVVICPCYLRIWRIACSRLNLPVPVFLKRLAAPRCVLSFGMTSSLRSPAALTAGRPEDAPPQVLARASLRERTGAPHRRPGPLPAGGPCRPGRSESRASGCPPAAGPFRPRRPRRRSARTARMSPTGT